MLKKFSQLPLLSKIAWGGIALLLTCCICGQFIPTPDDTTEQAAVNQVAQATAVDPDESEPALAPTSRSTEPPAPTSTETPLPTSTSTPANTPTLTNTPEPTNTPTPTNTPAPTNTPKPTSTPTPLPTPIILTGTGDSIVDVDRPMSPALVRIEGNASSRHFSVINYGSNGERIDLLVNTTSPYQGVRPLDFLADEHTTRFEVSASGAWTIEIIPLSNIEFVDVPGEISGTGDYVFGLRGNPDTAAIQGNSTSNFFAVISYGNQRNLLVNTTDPYEGVVIVPSGTLIIEVQASADWVIDIKE